MIRRILILLAITVTAYGQQIRGIDLHSSAKDTIRAIISDSLASATNYDSVRAIVADSLAGVATTSTISDSATATSRKVYDIQTAWTDDSNDSVYVPDGSTITNSSRTLQVGTIDTSNFGAVIRAYIAKEIRKGVLSGLAGQDTTGYWVAKDGNDSNAGNFTNPWLTLEKADATATAGDTIHVKAGTYIENDGGTWNTSKKLHWIAEGRVIVGTAGTTYLLNSTSTDTVFFDGFTFDGGDSVTTMIYKNAAGALKFTDCKFYSQKATGKGFYMLGAGPMLLDNCYIYFAAVSYGWDIRTTGANRIDNSTIIFANTVTTGIYLRPTSGSLVMRNNRITSNAATTFLHSDECDWTIAQSTITAGTVTSLFSNGAQTGGTVKVDTNAITVTRSTASMFFAATGTGMDYYIRGNNVKVTSTLQDDEILEIRHANKYIVQGNTIETWTEQVGSTPIYCYTTSTLSDSVNISGNVIKTRAPTGYGIAIGTESTTAQDDYLDSAVVRSNTIYGPAYYSGSLTGVTIHGIFVGFNKSPDIRYNKVYGCGYGIVDKGSSTAGGVVAYNVLTDCWQGIRLKGVQTTSIYNNSVFNNIDFAVTGIYLSNNTGADGSINSNVRNNSIQINTASTMSNYGILIDTQSASGNTVNYNLIKMSSGYIGGNNGTAYDTWAGWQGIGFDANGINSDPLYLLPESNKLKLTSRSPGINAGTSVGESIDIDGNSISGNPDIGAYEK